MCGIFGEFVIEGRLTEPSLFKRLNDLNTKRGPDSDGVWSDERCQLGFRRLAILDLSEAGNQPMLSSNGKWAMVFNGEIYNFSEIKEKLPHGKYTFKGHSDTEAILYAFDHFGIETTVKMLDGMFGIALYDVLNKEIYLMRDFAGIKPLFYAYDGKRLVFASQYDQLYLHPHYKDNEIAQEALKIYLRLHYVPAPYAILKNTFSLEPGKVLKISSDGQLESKTFWSFPEHEVQYSEEKEAIDYVAAELDHAVRAEMISDVPLGSFLSGGIDSPLITYYAQKNLNKPLRSFTIGSDSKVHDESDDASFYADAIGVDLHLRKMNSSDALSILDDVMDSLKEPFADFSIIPTFLVSRMAKEHVTVVLSGDGGDELFFGYERYHSVLKNLPFRAVPKNLRYLAYGLDKIFFKNKHINDNFLFSSIGRAHEELHSRFRSDIIYSIFPHLANATKPKDFQVYGYNDSIDIKKMLWNMQKAEFYGMMQKTLTKVDRASMANSLEVRVPFLKKSFIEASLKIDPFLSYSNSTKKELLKRLLKKNISGAPIAQQKRGFTVPLSKWIREDLKDSFRETLASKDFLEGFDIQKEKIEELFNAHISGKQESKWAIFTLYSLAKWFEKRSLSRTYAE